MPPMSADREVRLLTEIQDSMEQAVRAGVIRTRVTDDRLSGTSVQIDGRTLVNFGSCSYLGLGHDERLKRAAIAAVDRFGASYSSSATYSAVGLYTELERLLGQVVLDHPLVIAPTTTLMHLAALPVLVRSSDVVVIDVLAHASLGLTMDALRGRGVRVKTVPHSDMNAVESAVRRFENDADRVWLVVDGVYSMFGDIAPLADIWQLLAAHPGLHVYVDDAHGFGWAGDLGRGVVLGEHPLDDRVFVALSLSKAFGAGGGALVSGSRTSVERVLHTGGTLTFGGPINPAALGAGVAAAEVMLSPEHQDRKSRLMRLIDATNRGIADRSLPAPSVSRTPIKFIEIGTTDAAIRFAKVLMLNGFYTNVAAFPVVPRGHAGVRFTITADHSLTEIEALLDTIQEYLDLPDAVDLRTMEDSETVVQ